MEEQTKWVPAGSEPEHCPYCSSSNIRINETGSYGSCDDCEGNFVIRYFKPKPQAKRSISREELWAKMRRAGL